MSHNNWACRKVKYCIVFAWQGFGSRGATVMTFVKSNWKLPTCPSEPMPTCSKTDAPPTDDKSISNGGSTTELTYLRRRGVGTWGTAARERSENM